MNFALEPLETFPGVANGAIDRLYLHQAVVPHTIPTIEAFARGMRRMTRLYGQRYLVLFIGQLSRIGAPDDQSRARFATMLRDTSILPAAAALAILSTGLIAATGRSIVTGILMAARLPIPVRVFGSVADAVQFLDREAQGKGISLPRLDAVETALGTLRRSAEQALQAASG